MERYGYQIERHVGNGVWKGTDRTGQQEYDGTGAEYGRPVLAHHMDQLADGHFRPPCHQMTAGDHRLEMIVRFAIWDQAANTAGLAVTA